MIYSITPCSKPRMTRSDKWKKRPCVTKYWSFKDECRKQLVVFENGQNITFFIPMPKSWSKKKKEDHVLMPVKTRPDIDNYLKALFDALYDEDSHIWHVGRIKKLYNYEGGIQIV